MHPVIQEFQKLIEEDPALYMEFNLMFDQVPVAQPFDVCPNGTPQVRIYLAV